MALGLRSIDLALRALTGAALAVTAAALLWPVSVPADQIAPVGLEDPPAGARHGREDPAWARAIVAGDIFSASRRAPAVRYRPAGAAGESAGVPATEGESGSSEVPRLYGIVPSAGGDAALLRLDPAVAGALLYRAGDRGGSYRVETIGEESVVLSGPRGRVELRLRRPGGCGRGAARPQAPSAFSLASAFASGWSWAPRPRSPPSRPATSTSWTRRSRT